MSDLSFSIDPGQCMVAHGEIDRAGKAIMSLLSDVESEGKILLQVWEGEAYQTYQARQKQWHADAEVILHKLQQINQGLERAVQLYTQADRRGVEIITGG
jgi:WXG100 family type VII secretion target